MDWLALEQALVNLLHLGKTVADAEAAGQPASSAAAELDAHVTAISNSVDAVSQEVPTVVSAAQAVAPAVGAIVSDLKNTL